MWAVTSHNNTEAVFSEHGLCQRFIGDNEGRLQAAIAEKL
jgi:hypothetical protein